MRWVLLLPFLQREKQTKRDSIDLPKIIQQKLGSNPDQLALGYLGRVEFPIN